MKNTVKILIILILISLGTQNTNVSLNTRDNNNTKSYNVGHSLITRSANNISDYTTRHNTTIVDTHIQALSPKHTLLANTIVINANITSGQILKSHYTIHISLNSIVQTLSCKLSTSNTTTNTTGPLSSFNYVLPNFFSITQLSLNLNVTAYDSNNVSISTKTFYFNVDDQWVFIKSISSQGKLLPNSQLPISFDVAPLGIQWRWDPGNIVKFDYSPNPIITTPSTDGSYRLDLLITNPSGTDQPVVNYFYYIDGTAPPLVILTDISQPLPAGQQILFQNTTDAGLDKNYFNFTIQGSGVYTTSFPIVPSPVASYVLIASVHDELNNTRTNSFIIKAKIGVLHIFPSLAGKSNTTMNITFSETPFYQDFVFYYPNNTVYSSSYTVPNLPIPVGTYTFKIHIMDTLSNCDNYSYSITVDNTPPVFFSVSPGNNSYVYSSSVISLTFDTIPFNLIYNFNNSINKTGTIMIPNIAGIWILHIFASNYALNWLAMNFTYTRYYQPILSYANNSYVSNNFNLTVLSTFPVSTSFIHWDHNPLNVAQ